MLRVQLCPKVHDIIATPCAKAFLKSLSQSKLLCMGLYLWNSLNSKYIQIISLNFIMIYLSENLLYHFLCILHNLILHLGILKKLVIIDYYTVFMAFKMTNAVDKELVDSRPPYYANCKHLIQFIISTKTV